MFNTTHTLAGLAIARLGPERWARHATATAVIASNLPDIDSLAGLWGTATYLDHHRGITHSLAGMPVLALVLAVAMYRFSGEFLKTYAVALISIATHPLLDYLNFYGVRPFLPFNSQWFYGDALFIFDPYLDLILLTGVVLGALRPPLKRAAVLVSVIAAMSYIGVRIEFHAMTARRVEMTLSDRGLRDRWAVLPRMRTPFKWDAIATTATEAIRFEAGPFSESGPGTLRRIDASSDAPLVSRAATAPAAAALLRFARFPVVQVEPLPDGHRVRFFDLRFFRDDSRTALAAEVTLDASMNIRNATLSFLLPIPN